MKHIGMDLHSSTTDVCVRNGKGEIVLRRRLETTRTELQRFVADIPGPKRIAVEESQMADWATRVLQPHVDEAIRCQPQFNKLISASEDKCDKKDAESISELLYLNRLKRVHHPNLAYRTLRQTVRAYWIASRELTRAKNRLKGLFLFHGLHETGDKIYSVPKQSGYLKKLERAGGNVELGQLLYERLDHCRQLKAKHIRLARKSARPMNDLVRLLMTMPAIGAIYAYTLVAYLEDGRRFPNKRKLWRYAGLALRKHESRDIGARHVSFSGSRLVKYVAMSAAATIACRRGDNALSELWEKEIRNKVDPEQAQRNLARKIVAIAQCLLRSKQEYSDEQVKG